MAEDSSNNELHVAIIGAGIAGLALAMSLHKSRVPFTIYEEAKQHSAVGAGIGFGPNGLSAMKMIEPDFLPKYEAICVGNKPRDAQNVFFEGLLLEDGLGLEEEWCGKSSWGHEDYVRRSAHRKALLDIMTSFVPIEHVRFDKRVSGISQHSNGVTLTFADGEAIEAGVVVGADGIQSVVRKHVLQDLHPSEVEPMYAKSYCYRAVIPIAEADEILGDLTDVAKMYMGHNRSCVTYRISGGEEFNFLLAVAEPDQPWSKNDAVTEKVSYEEMMADFQGHGVDERFLRLLNKAPPIKWGLFHHAQTSTYYKGRVVLAGDSAHASLPYQAAGASQALEDAVVLGSLLAEASERTSQGQAPVSLIHAALESYDAVRRPRAQRQLEQSADVALLIHFQHPEAGANMRRILPRMQEGRFEWLWFHDVEGDVRRARERMVGGGGV